MLVHLDSYRAMRLRTSIELAKDTLAAYDKNVTDPSKGPYYVIGAYRATILRLIDDIDELKAEVEAKS